MSWAVYEANDAGSNDWRILVLSPISDSDSTAYTCDAEEISAIYEAAESALGDDSYIAVKCTGGVTAYPVIATAEEAEDDESNYGASISCTFTQTDFYDIITIYDYSESTNLTSVPTGAFCGDATVTNVVLPETVTQISDKAFFGCVSLAGITAVKYTAATEENTAADITTADSASEETSETDVTTEENTSETATEADTTTDDSTTAADSETETETASASYTSVTLSVTEIGAGAFADCEDLTDTIWNTLDAAQIETIGESAFAGTQVTLDAEKLVNLANDADIESAQVATATDAAAEDTSEPVATALTDENTVSENEATTTESENDTDDEGIAAYAEEDAQITVNDDGSIEITVDGTTIDSSHLPDGTALSSGNLSYKTYTDGTNTVLVLYPTDPSADYTLGSFSSITDSYDYIKLLAASSTTTSGTTTTYSGLTSLDTTLKNTASVIDLSDCLSLTTINYKAFFDDTGLTSIALPASLTAINQQAFQNCTGLTSITFPDSLTTIGTSAFHTCTGLTSVTLPKSLKTIESNAFENCISLKIVTIPDGCQLTSIGQRAFYGCKALTSIELGNAQNLETIGNYAFYACEKLEGITLSSLSALKSIGAFAFAGCHSLTEVVIENLSNLTEICNHAFMNCWGLKKIAVKNNSNLESIGERAFHDDNSTYGNKLTEVTISGNPKLNKIGDYAFNWLYQGAATTDNAYLDLRNNGTANGVKLTIGGNVMYHLRGSGNTDNLVVDLSGCTGLTALPANGIACDWKNHASLTEINLSNTGITSIPANYFDNSTHSGQYASLSTVDLSDCTSLATIGASAFYGDTALTTLDLTGCTALTTIGESAFYGDTSLKELDMTKSVLADTETTVTDATTGETTTTTTMAIGKNAFYGDTALTSVKFSGGSVSIGDSAFNGCTRLSELYVNPTTLAAVGTAAFTGIGSASLTIGVDTTGICANAFSTLNTSEVLFESKEGGKYITIGDGAFSNSGEPLASLPEGTYYVDENGVLYSDDQTILYYVPPGIKAYTLPATVTTVATNALRLATDLETLTIASGSMLATVNASGFANCPTLRKVVNEETGNYATTIQEAITLLKSIKSGMSIGSQAFYKTGLTGTDYDIKGTLTSDELYYEAQVSTEETTTHNLKVTLDQDKGFGASSKALQDDTNRISDLNPSAIVDKIQYLYSGSNTTLDFALDGGSTKEAVGRIYLRMSDIVKIKIGTSDAEVDQTYQITDESDHTKVFSMKQIKGTDIYYIEFPIISGDTFQQDDLISLTVDNMTADEVTLAIWCDVVSSADAVPLEDPPTGYSCYQQVNWETAMWNWTIPSAKANDTSYNAQKSTDSSTGDTSISLDSDMTFVFKAQSSYKTNANQGVSAGISYTTGADPVKYVAFTQTLTLPTGMKTTALGDLTYDSDSDCIYLSDGTLLAKISPPTVVYGTKNATRTNTANDVTITGATLSEDGSTITISWNVDNLNVDSYNYDSNIDYIQNTVTFEQGAFELTEDEYDFTKEGTIAWTYTQRPVRVYGGGSVTGETELSYVDEGVYTQTAAGTLTIEAAELALSVQKTAADKTYYMGESADYTITVTNTDAIISGNPNMVSDTLPTGFVIRPDDIEAMLNDSETGSVLTITIKNAVSYKQTASGNSEETVQSVLKDEITLTPEQKADANTKTPLSDIVISWETETKGDETNQYIRVTCGNDSVSIGTGTKWDGTKYDYASLDAYFTAIGFMNTNADSTKDLAATTYTCVWDYTGTTGMDEIAPGGSREYEIYDEVMTTFEYLLSTGVSSISNFSKSVRNEKYQMLADGDTKSNNNTNTATVTYDTANRTGKTESATCEIDPLSELSLSKTYSAANNYTYGSQITYTVSVTKAGTETYEDVPLHDEITGDQALLVSASLNKNLGTTYSTAALTSDKKYYELKAGTDGSVTYENVYVGTSGGTTFLADRIVVTKDTTGLKTEIYWYLDEVAPGTTQVKYLTVIDETLGENENTGDLSFGNTAYLNERTDDMLMASKAPGGILSKGSSKTICVDRSDEKKDKTYTSISIGESVTYRIKLTNKNTTYAQTFTNVYDKLPSTYSKFKWVTNESDTNNGKNGLVKIEYASDKDTGDLTSRISGAVTAYDPYSNTDASSISEPVDNYYINWNNMGSVTVAQEETLTIYVTLTFPSDTDVWDNYNTALETDTGNAQMLHNYFYRDGTSTYVSHQLKNPCRAVLQKGVYGIYRYDTTIKATTELDIKQVYSVPSATQQDYICYYVTIYNAGSSKFYLGNIEDVLPEGFTFQGLCTSVTAGSIPSAFSATTVATDTMATVTDDDRNITYVTGKVSGSSATTEDGDTRLTFSVSTSSGGTLKSDGTSCYLAKDEALVFGYFVKVGSADISTAENTAAMEFVDKDSVGLALADEVTIAATNTDEENEYYANDGSKLQLTDATAIGKGFADDTGNAADWLASAVSVTEGEISPGVTKNLTGYIHDDGTITGEGSFDDKVLSATVKVQEWTISLYNSGSTSIDSYTVTDTMESPYIFNSNAYTAENALDATDVTLVVGGTSYTYTLFRLKSIDTTEETFQIQYGDGKGGTNYTGTIKFADLSGSSTAYTSIDGNIEFYVSFNVSSDGDMYMQLKFVKQANAAIPAMSGTIPGQVDIVVRTAKDSSESSTVFKDYRNNVTFDPADAYAPNEVTKGKVTVSGIEAEDMFFLASAYATTAWIKVTDKNNPENTASSKDEENYISLDPDGTDFTYSLKVKNMSGNALDKMVVVCNLPQSGDAAATSTSSRGSEYMVSFRDIIGEDGPNITVKQKTDLSETTYLYSADGTNSNGDSLDAYYTIEFSTKISFQDTTTYSDVKDIDTENYDDDGKNEDRWVSYAEILKKIEDGADKDTLMSSFRSFRIIIHGTDSVSGITSEISSSVVSFDVPATITGETLPDQIAWCNFGYYYEDTSDEKTTALMATSGNVGVKVATVPRIRKTLDTSTSSGKTAVDLGVSASFLVYEASDAISAGITGDTEYEKEQSLLKALCKNGKSFSVITLSPEQIDSGQLITPISKDVGTLSDEEKPLYTECWTCTAYQDTNGVYRWKIATETDSTTGAATYIEWEWKTGTSYTFTEIDLDDRVEFRSMNNDPVNSATITYTSDGVYSIKCTNIYDDYDLTLTKTGVVETTDETTGETTDTSTGNLAGASIARYKVVEFPVGKDYSNLLGTNTATDTNAGAAAGSRDQALAAAQYLIMKAWSGTWSGSDTGAGTTGWDILTELAASGSTSASIANSGNAVATGDKYLIYLSALKSKNENYQLSLPSSGGTSSVLSAVTTYSELVTHNAAETVKSADAAGEYFCYAYLYDDDSSNSVYAYICMDVEETSDSAGTITYSGMTDDGYVFREVVAPSGYQLNYSLTTFTKQSSSGTTQQTSISDPVATELPMTGGSGTGKMYLLGFVLMMLATIAVGMLWANSRKRLTADARAGTCADSGGSWAIQEDEKERGHDDG